MTARCDRESKNICIPFVLRDEKTQILGAKTAPTTQRKLDGCFRHDVVGSSERVVKPDDSNVPDPVMVKTNIDPASDRRDEYGGHKFVKPEDGVKTLRLEDGMVANLFASEEMFPEMVNPVQMDVDTQGRLWVAAWETYPKWQPDQEMLDRLLILPDEDRDGVADEAITFAYVHNPTGFTFWNGGVIVASAPEILFLKDTDGTSGAGC